MVAQSSDASHSTSPADSDAHHRQQGDQFAANHRCGRQQELLSAFICLVQDVVAMVEVVELLRQLEGVLGGVGRFCGGDALLDDSSMSSLPAARAPRFRCRCRRRRSARSPLQPTSACSGSTPALRKMLLARTTAYCAYGPVSPSNASASLKSNAITDCLVNFSMK